MTETTFSTMLIGIYATFGKEMNLKRGVVNYAYSKILEKNIPDAAVPFILDAFASYTALPSNLIKAISEEAQRWKTLQPVTVIPCPYHCEGGHFYAWAPTTGTDTRWMAYAAVCAHCAPASRYGTTPATVQQLGHRIMPHGYEGGPIAYDRDNALGAMVPTHSLNSSKQGNLASMDIPRAIQKALGDWDKQDKKKESRKTEEYECSVFNA